MDSILVTAVVTTYKRDFRVLKRAIDSVLNQTYKNIEVYVINDDPDNIHLSEEIERLISNSNRNINYVVMEKNSGACAARNKGLSLANGEYIAFLDDDDEWLPEKIAAQLEYMSSDVDIVYSDAYIIESSGKKELRSSNLRTKHMPDGYIIDYLLKDNIIGSASFPLIRKSVLKELGGFNESMPAIQDFELWIRICLKHKAAYVDLPLINYYRHQGDQISKHCDLRCKGMAMIYSIQNNFFRDNKAADAAFCRQLTIFYVVAGKKRLAYKYNVKAIILSPLELYENIFSTVRLLFRTFVKKKNV